MHPSSNCLLAGKDKPLLVKWNALLMLDLGHDVVDHITQFNFKGDGFAGQGLDKDLHTTTETIIVGEGVPRAVVQWQRNVVGQVGNRSRPKIWLRQYWWCQQTPPW